MNSMLDSRVHETGRCGPPLVVLGLGLVLAIVGGCASPTPDRDRTVDVPEAFMVEADRAFVRSPFEDQARAGMIRSRTIYDYHFEPDGAGLTAVGVRTVEAVASTGGGRLSVRRGGTAPALFEARVASVRERLLREGVAPERIVILDAPAGGRGVESVRAIEIRKDVRDNAMTIPTGQMLDNGGGQ